MPQPAFRAQANQLGWIMFLQAFETSIQSQSFCQNLAHLHFSVPPKAMLSKTRVLQLFPLMVSWDRVMCFWLHFHEPLFLFQSQFCHCAVIYVLPNCLHMFCVFFAKSYLWASISTSMYSMPCYFTLSCFPCLPILDHFSLLPFDCALIFAFGNDT